MTILHTRSTFGIEDHPRNPSRRTIRAVDCKDLIRALERDGWFWHATTGSHRHFKHPNKLGKITIPHPKKDMHPKTVRSILKAAGL